PAPPPLCIGTVGRDRAPPPTSAIKEDNPGTPRRPTLRSRSAPDHARRGPTTNDRLRHNNPPTRFLRRNHRRFFLRELRQQKINEGPRLRPPRGSSMGQT